MLACMHACIHLVIQSSDAACVQLCAQSCVQSCIQSCRYVPYVSSNDRLAWSASFSYGSVVLTCADCGDPRADWSHVPCLSCACFAKDMTPDSRRLTTASIHRADGSTQPPLALSGAVAGSPAVEPSSAQTTRRTGRNAAAARFMSTPKTGVSTRTAAQPGGVRPTAAQPNAGRAGQL